MDLTGRTDITPQQCVTASTTTATSPSQTRSTCVIAIDQHTRVSELCRLCDAAVVDDNDDAYDVMAELAAFLRRTGYERLRAYHLYDLVVHHVYQTRISPQLKDIIDRWLAGLLPLSQLSMTNTSSH